MIHVNKLLLEIRKDLFYVRSLFTADSLEINWKWYFILIAGWNLFPQYVVFFILLKLYKILIRYSFLLFDIFILDLLNISSANTIRYNSLRYFLKYILFDFWFVIIPNIIRTVFSVAFWLGLFLKAIEKVLFFIVDSALWIGTWVHKVLALRIPYYFKSIRSWYYFKRLQYHSNKLDFILYIDEQRLILLYNFLYSWIIIKRCFIIFQCNIVYWVKDKFFSFKLIFIYYKYYFKIRFCKIYYWFKLYSLDSRYCIKIISILKVLLTLAVYRVGEILYCLSILIRYKSSIW